MQKPEERRYVNSREKKRIWLHLLLIACSRKICAVLVDDNAAKVPISTLNLKMAHDIRNMSFSVYFQINGIT